MYLCLCHGLNDRRVKEAAANCGGTVGSVFRSLGVQPRCKVCLPYIKSAVRAARREASEPEIVVSAVPAE